MPRACRPHSRRAVTLLEVILVLALLVVLASIAWPNLESMLAGLELRKSAERVRVQWDQARVEALSTGQTVLFRFAPEGNRFYLEYRPEPEFAPGTATGSTDNSDLPSREGTLPERITIVDSEISELTDPLLAEGQSAIEGDWSEPIVFYPDGTTSDATLVLENQRGQCVDVSIRGLTGVVTIGAVYEGGEAGS